MTSAWIWILVDFIKDTYARRCRMNNVPRQTADADIATVGYNAFYISACVGRNRWSVDNSSSVQLVYDDG